MVAADGSQERPMFGRAATEDGQVDPWFTAVSDGHGGIAGYVDASVLDGSVEVPPSDDGAPALSDHIGLVMPTFDTNGVVVGYWADERGFVDEQTKDALVARGWRYVEGATPDPSGTRPSSRRVSVPGTVRPSTMPR